MVGDIDGRRSTSGMLVFLGAAPIAWQSLKQKIVALSTYEAEYVAAATAACWLRRLLAELIGEEAHPPALMVDNQPAISLAKNPILHNRSKHIDIKFHFLRVCVNGGQIVIEFIETGRQLTDILTKSLGRLPFMELRKMICMDEVIKDFASGEIKQASTLFDCDITLDDYLLKSYYKTASLIAASTRSAAIFSGVSTSICEQMYEYGRNLGLSFQVVDDILDFTQSAEQLGKPAGSDLAKGNLTAPVIFALQDEPELREIIDSEFSETDSLAAAIELVHRSGGIRRAHELAREKGDMAIQNLQCLPRSDFRSTLESMVKYNLERIE
uniref:Uncharacterized protein n=1 Tax=Sorghum bicolor TaxID=4558 RepID=C6JRM8_SORBI